MRNETHYSHSKTGLGIYIDIYKQSNTLYMTSQRTSSYLIQVKKSLLQGQAVKRILQAF